jgi:hypothetical protein
MQKAWAHLRSRAERVRGVGETEGLGGFDVEVPFGWNVADAVGAGAGDEVEVAICWLLLMWCFVDG